MANKSDVQKQLEEGHKQMEQDCKDIVSRSKAQEKADAAMLNEVNKNTTK